MKASPSRQCQMCSRLLPVAPGPAPRDLENDGFEHRCTAFPGGIPKPILDERHDHRRSFEGDGGFLFVPIDAQAAREVDRIFGGRLKR